MALPGRVFVACRYNDRIFSNYLGSVAVAALSSGDKRSAFGDGVSGDVGLVFRRRIGWRDELRGSVLS